MSKRVLMGLVVATVLGFGAGCSGSPETGGDAETGLDAGADGQEAVVEDGTGSGGDGGGGDVSASDSGDGGGGSAGEVAFSEVGNQGAYGTISYGEDGRALNVRWTDGVDICAAYRGNVETEVGAQVLRVVVDGVSPGTYPLADDLFFEPGEASGQAHAYFLYKHEEATATYRLVAGEVEILEGGSSDNETVELRVDLEVPDRPAGSQTCSGEPRSCRCKRLSGETFQCESSGGAERCCLEPSRYDETLRWQKTLQADHCGEFDQQR